MDIEINCVDKFYVQKMHETGVEHALECTFSNLESNFFSRRIYKIEKCDRNFQINCRHF